MKHPFLMELHLNSDQMDPLKWPFTCKVGATRYTYKIHRTGGEDSTLFIDFLIFFSWLVG